MRIRAKSGEKLENILAEIKNAISQVDIDWERKQDPKDQDIYFFEGTIGPLKILVYKENGEWKRKITKEKAVAEKELFEKLQKDFENKFEIIEFVAYV